MMLTDYWTSQGLQLVAGCAAAAITAFERRHHVVLPSAVRAYYQTVNGMKQTSKDACDSNGFSFWPLDQVTPIDEFLETYRWPTCEGCAGFFVFADYLQLSWAYAIRLARTPGNPVVLIGKERPELVAASFDDFVTAYLEDAASLYGGPVFDSSGTS